MTGSIKDFNYVSDENVNYAIRRDESSGEATIAGTLALLPVVLPATYTPKGLRERYVNAILQTDARVKKRFTVGTIQTFNSIRAGDTVIESTAGRNNGGTYRILSKRGERSRFPSSIDTGLDDGDPD